MNGELHRRLAPALVLGLLATAATGQSDETGDVQFSEVIDVELVNVEVWVTDGSGQPVRGLTADDFELFEDGKPVAIGYFSEVRQDVRLPARTSPVAAPAPAGPEPQQAAEAEPSHLILYFDQLHLSPSHRRRALETIRDFLATGAVDPARVLILRQDQALTTEATFGSSWSELDEALERIGKTQARGGMMRSEKRLAIRNLQELWTWAKELAGRRATGDSREAACQIFLPRAIPDIENYAAESRERIAVSLDDMAAVASFLTGVPGLKTLLYVSDTLERAPGTDLVTFVRDLCPVQIEAPMFLLSDELSTQFRDLTRHANANRVTIYSLQAQGLESGFLTGASEAGLGVDVPSVHAFDTAQRTSEREGLAILAAETGGRTIFNTNDFADDLVAIAGEMSSYYSLAYEPPHAGDKTEHEIEVKLRNKGLRARHRQGYRDKSADERMTERLQGAVYLGLVDNPLGVRLAAGALSQSDRGEFVRLPLHVLVPSDKIAFLPREAGVTAQLSVQVSTRNTVDQKGIFDHRAYRVNWQTPTDRDVVDLVMDLEVPPGVHLVAVGVRDDATRDTSFVSTTVEVHAAGEAAGTRP